MLNRNDTIVMEIRGGDMYMDAKTYQHYQSKNMITYIDRKPHFLYYGHAYPVFVATNLPEGGSK